MKLNKIHHVAVICSDYEKSKHFYTDVLGMKIVSENYREGRDSWKADCFLGDTYVIELFSFPNPPARSSYPEAAGLRHLAFEVDELSVAIDELDNKGIAHEPIRTDEYTGKRFVFFSDPDGLPIVLQVWESTYVNKIPKRENQEETPGKWGKKRWRIFP